MAIADELRQYADKVIKEGGMYYSGEYLSRIAKTAENLEAENDKLREQGARLFDKTLELATKNAKLQELVEDMWLDGMCECDERLTCDKCEYHYTDRMRELGIEVD